MEYLCYCRKTSLRWIADARHEGRSNFGDEAVAQFEEQFELDLRDMRAALALEAMSVRKAGLSDEYHSLVARRVDDAEKQMEWLETAERENLSPRELASSISANRVVRMSEQESRSGVSLRSRAFAVFSIYGCGRLGTSGRIGRRRDRLACLRRYARFARCGNGLKSTSGGARRIKQMNPQSTFPDSDGWGVRPWAPKREQPSNGAKAVANLFPIDIWQALISEPDAVIRRVRIERIYDTYMCSRAWQERRRRALKSAKDKCARCPRTERLEVHHLTSRRFRRELPEDLEVLCHHCHPGRDEARRVAIEAWIRDLEDLAEMRNEDARLEAFHRSRCDGCGYDESSREEIEESKEAFDEMLRESGDY